jgi:hypothetical protein
MNQKDQHVLSQIAFYQGRRDEIRNQDLAKQLVESNDRAGIQIIADHLHDANSSIASDCLKVLYEIGYLNPEFIEDYYELFLDLLDSPENRLVWGAMLALSLVAVRNADALFPYREKILQATQGGSVITRDNGIKTLARIAAYSEGYQAEILPHLFNLISTCRAKEVPQYAESISPAVDGVYRQEFRQVLQARLPELSSSQAARVKKVLKGL